MATAKLSFKPQRGPDLDLSKWAPGFDSEIARRWGKHVLPGQKGQLIEDLGEGSLGTTVSLAFTSLLDYNQIMQTLAESPRGQLVHSRRGTRRSVLTRIKESVRWTQRGQEVTLVDLTFEDAALSEPDQFQGGPAAQSQNVRAQAVAAIAAVDAQKTRIEGRRVDAANLILRTKIAAARALATSTTEDAKGYAAAALAAWSSGTFDPSLSIRLRSLPVAVEKASVALRATGPAHEVQAAIVAMELMLKASSDLDAAIRASQPVPIETEVTRAGGQSLYQFVQQHYARRGKTPAQMREIVRTIQSWNRNLRRPDLIPQGDVVLRPAA